MVLAAAQVNGPFFEHPESRRGLARIENLCRIAAYSEAKLRGERGDAGEPLEEIHGDPFCHQQ